MGAKVKQTGISKGEPVLGLAQQLGETRGLSPEGLLGDIRRRGADFQSSLFKDVEQGLGLNSDQSRRIQQSLFSGFGLSGEQVRQSALTDGPTRMNVTDLASGRFDSLFNRDPIGKGRYRFGEQSISGAQLVNQVQASYLSLTEGEEDRQRQQEAERSRQLAEALKRERESLRSVDYGEVIDRTLGGFLR